MVRVRSQDPPRGSDRVRGTDWCQFSKKNPRLVGWLGSGPRLVGRVGSGVLVSDSYHVLSCVVVRAVSGQVLCTP